ncbi:hypothetical protein DMA11_12145 [Marinilabiliaceae bacterium JC017]|nr:hypothetical protein DMA11_12145 [Marinilabiliaceae bacterium JC017]
MKKLTLLFGLILCLSAMAEKQPDWTLPMEGKPMAIFKHSFTGIPIVETSNYYYGINYVDKSILWSVKKAAGQEALNKAENISAMTGAGSELTTGSQYEKYREIPFTPFVSINNHFADVSTGKVLIGQGEDKYKNIISHNILPDLYKLLVKVKAESGAKVLYCIDLKSKSLQWKQTLAAPSGAKDIMKAAKASSSLGALNVDGFTPQTTADNNIVYKHDKVLFLINSSNGDIIWQNECKPGTFFLDNKQQALVVINQASGASNLMAIKGPKAFGKEMFAIDLKTGKELWKKPVKLSEKYTMQVNLDDELFVVAHEKGVNIYDFKTGTKKWKKDYDTKRVQDIVVKTDGIEVFYGNKIMLINKTTGKKAWKKPIEFDDVPEDAEGDMIKREYEKGTFIVGTTFVGLFNKATGKKIWKMSLSPDSKTAFDNRNNKVAILDGKKFYVFDPNTVKKKAEKIKLDIEEPSEIIGFETMKGGYFITGMNEYIMLSKTGEVVNHNYFKPLKTDRLLKAALSTASIATGVMATEVTFSDSETGEELYSGGLFMSTSNARAMGEISRAQSDAIRKLKNDAKLRGAARSTKDFAFFLKGEKLDGQDHMSIVKVEKKTGKEVDSFDFGDNRKVIYELDKVTNKLYYLDNGKLVTFDLN